MDRVIYRRHVSEMSSQSTPLQDNNLLRLKRISQSFDDLTSETLYSRWKKARKNSAKTDRRGRSISLSSLPEEELDINGYERRYETKSLAARLQRQVFRPRGWTVCNGELSRDIDKERGVVNASNTSRDSLSDLSALSPTEVDRPPITIADSSENLDDDVFSISTVKPELKDSIETKKSKIISEIMAGTPPSVVRKVRSLSDSDRRMSDVPSLRRRLISDPNSTGRTNSERRARSLSCREPREIEFLRAAEMAQRYLENSMVSREDIWQKRSSTGDLEAEGRHKRSPRTSVIHARSEVNNNACNIQEASLGFPNDRSQPDAKKRYLLGCAYALISQPEPTVTNSIHEDSISKVNLQNHDKSARNLTRAMSEPSKGPDHKESRSTEEKERDDRTVKFKEVQFVSDFKESQRTEVRHHGVRRAQTLPRMPKRPLNSTSRNWKENELKTRKAAEDLIYNINNTDDKNAQERVDVVEKAFEWIRKEVADLRDQDKDIMRMFTKIQAGIRHIKFEQSALMESEEEFISTPDLSTTDSASVTGIHRRASLL